MNPFEYYFDQLSRSDQRFYREMLGHLSQRSDKFTVSLPAKPDVHRVMEAIRNDHSELFYLEALGRYTWRETAGGTVTMEFAPDYRFSAAETRTLERKIRAEADRVIRAAGRRSPRDTALFFHDWLVRECEYSTRESGQSFTHRLDGPFLYRRCVCEGFAKAFKYLCDSVGIPCMEVTGAANGGGKNGPHSWNIVRIGSRYYCVDVTFDNHDTSYEAASFCSRASFLISTQMMLRNHTPDREFSLPNCPAEDSGLMVVRTAAELRSAMKAGPERGGCREIRLAPGVSFDALRSQASNGLSNADISWWNAVKGFTTTSSGNVIIRW